MATIRAYTTIEQSRKLAEILPPESADMGWYYTLNPEAARNQMWLGTKPENADIPCWSLAALLGVLPEGTSLLKAANISSVGDIKYHCDCPKDTVHEWYDNPVDACYEMILTLHELKML